MIADPNDFLAPIEVTVMIWCASWIVNNHSWGPALDYMYGDVVKPGECQDLRLPAPDPSISYCSTVNFKLSRSHEPGVSGANPVFAVYRGQEGKEIIRVGIDVIGRGCACGSIICLLSGKYPENRELVGDRGE